MNEMMKVTSQNESKETEYLSEKVVTEYGGVYEHQGEYYASTYDGERIVSVPKETADMIGLALRAQAKVFEGTHPNLEKKLRMLNCRKAAFAASGRMTAAEATDEKSDDINGLEHLFDDVERLQDEGYHPYLVFDSYVTEVEFFLNEYEGEFPCVVHLFEFEKNGKKAEIVEAAIENSGELSRDDLARLHRTHSFVVLGQTENGFVCFQKLGPGIEKPFMIAELDHMLFSYPLAEDREGVAFLGPM